MSDDIVVLRGLLAAANSNVATLAQANRRLTERIATVNAALDRFVAVAHLIYDQRWCGRCGRRVEDAPHAIDCPVGQLGALIGMDETP